MTPARSIDRTDRCSTRSEGAGETLAGTASTIRRWLLIEHAGPWGRDGLRDARLPDGVGEALRALERRTGSRVLLIRRPVRERGDGTACIAVDTADAWMGGTSLDSIERAVGLDPSDRAAFPLELGQPVAVVCTHGRRDACCAERGRPLAAAAAAAFPRVVWESTHVGGDRFAGNLVMFPHGLMFGRVEPERAAGIVAAYGEGRIELDRFRGRTSHPMSAQAADSAVRALLGLDRIGDVIVLDVERHGDLAHLRLRLPAGDARVVVERRELRPMRLTCAAMVEEPPVDWVVRDMELPG
ncbi:MAG TPA: sucrase ferredoxin [Actinomycetota bacterium]|nr:sucrase ferredoxin [Actinomycetota bacterium]